jgi:hypothetical protein
VVTGENRSYCLTEPSAAPTQHAEDVAKRTGDHYVLSGSKVHFGRDPPTSG